jgi:ElaB/YqjD/DUF883 family membrane-anchored ribosome-binding protein
MEQGSSSSSSSQKQSRRSDLQTTSDLMRKNVQKALERGKALKQLEGQTRSLYKEAPLFAKEADRLASWKQHQYNIWKAVAIGVILGLVYGLIHSLSSPLVVISAGIGGLMAFSLMKVGFSFRETVKNCPSLHPTDDIDAEFKRKAKLKAKQFLTIFDPMYTQLKEENKKKPEKVQLNEPLRRSPRLVSKRP